ncbi:PREDICTED: NAC domain-containing protein 86-like [Camelina sativa]|uniref:NAC domain-containing protein 86-like n=1 Tax=Camelina sativa TaxID=90675 RepID=A0ABM0USQ1_CAMSA|nr:PREDICTED: NAC domain-containing protein 86-like [Camelina sativa]
MASVSSPAPESSTAATTPEIYQLAISLPPGFFFQPSPDDLLFYYLKGKVSNEDFTDAIAEVDIYKYEAWDLPGHSKLKSTTNVWFFFTPARKYNRGSRTKRVTPHGRWRVKLTEGGGGSKKKEFKDQNSDLSGTMKPFNFYTRNIDKKEKLTSWSMEEYRLDNFDTFSLCKLFQRKKEEEEPNPAMVEQPTEIAQNKNVQQEGGDNTLHDTSSSSSDDDAATALLMIPQART